MTNRYFIDMNLYRGIENKLDDDIEEAKNILDKERIEMGKAYDNCSITLKEFDTDNYQFSKDVDVLLNVYADAAKNVIISYLLFKCYQHSLNCLISFFSKVTRYCGHKCL